jgi:hypothetical protein
MTFEALAAAYWLVRRITVKRHRILMLKDTEKMKIKTW